ncbi:hypothetical protein MOQ72_08965 [Saccharopolyspora sp. K220]|uniref:hypothetical protein n=1 Tax=Saccharopolyspora soli TaxID=2926618 RepID=UPI001F593537|nr:hypothetical protein [Saccharopolyspora soli]MCI2417554.1 hypothetical protein [Saccharopolyspora soli]
MALFQYSGISVESCVEMEDEAPMRYEIDRLNGLVVLHCGQHGEYILTIGRENLAALVALGTEAIQQLATT